MAIEIVALERGGAMLARFRIEAGARVEEGNWCQVSDLVRNPGGRQGPLLEFFFCYVGTEALRCDRRLLEGLARQSDLFAAGARIHAVIDQGFFERFDLDWAVDSLNNWFLGASDVEVDDILECNLNPVNPILLRHAADRSYEREKVWMAARREDGWVAVLSNPKSRLTGFLEPYLLSPAKPMECCYVLLVEEREAETQRSVVETWLESHIADQTIVATVLYEHKESMKELCSERGLTRVRLRGPFELRYLLMNLNRSQSCDEVRGR